MLTASCNNLGLYRLWKCYRIVKDMERFSVCNRRDFFGNPSLELEIEFEAWLFGLIFGMMRRTKLSAVSRHLARSGGCSVLLRARPQYVKALSSKAQLDDSWARIVRSEFIKKGHFLADVDPIPPNYKATAEHSFSNGPHNTLGGQRGKQFAPSLRRFLASYPASVDWGALHIPPEAVTDQLRKHVDELVNQFTRSVGYELGAVESEEEIMWFEKYAKNISQTSLSSLSEACEASDASQQRVQRAVEMTVKTHVFEAWLREKFPSQKTFGISGSCVVLHFLYHSVADIV